MEVCSGRFCESATRLGTLSGQRSSLFSTLYTSNTNILSVVLRTDGRVAASGFRATVSAIEVSPPPPGIVHTHILYF